MRFSRAGGRGRLALRRLGRAGPGGRRRGGWRRFRGHNHGDARSGAVAYRRVTRRSGGGLRLRQPRSACVHCDISGTSEPPRRLPPGPEQSLGGGPRGPGLRRANVRHRRRGSPGPLSLRPQMPARARGPVLGRSRRWHMLNRDSGRTLVVDCSHEGRAMTRTVGGCTVCTVHLLDFFFAGSKHTCTKVPVFSERYIRLRTVSAKILVVDTTHPVRS